MLHRPRAHGAQPALHGIRVGMDDPHRLQGHAQLVGGDLRERRLVPLPERGGAAAHQHRAVALDADGSPLGADACPGHLDVDRQSDTQLAAVAALPAPRLLGAQSLVIRKLQQRIESPLVFAGVVGGAARGGVGEAVAGDQVAAAQLGRVHLKLGSQQVHGALDHRRGFRPAGTAIGAEGRRVGGYAVGLVADARDVVDARRHLSRQEGEQHGDARVSPDVRQHVRAQTDQAAVPLGAQLHLLDLPPTMRHRHQVLGPGLHPLQRPLQPARGGRHHHQLGTGPGLGAEAAAHVRNHDPDGALVHGQRGGDLRAQREGLLTGDPDAQALAFGHHQDRLRLHRHRR